MTLLLALAAARLTCPLRRPRRGGGASFSLSDAGPPQGGELSTHRLISKTMLPILVFVGALVAVGTAVLIPGPIGAFSVAMRTHELTDSNRRDPYSPYNSSSRRRILVSVFLPLDPVRHADARVQQLPYMPPLTAEEYGKQAAAIAPALKDVFSLLSIEYRRLETTAHPCGDYVGKTSSYPVVIFSPGLSGSRMMYAAGARDLASQGYVVITIDHPYDASIVEFPDGTVIRGINITTPADILHAVMVRAADVTFLINQLHDNVGLEHLTAGFSGVVDVEKMAIYGHSLGGATAAEVMLKDNRLLGGMNWDGQMQGDSANEGLVRPFVQLGVPGHRHMNGSNWAAFYRLLRGPKLELEVAGTTHSSFTDLPLLLSTTVVPPAYRPAVEQVLGTVNGRLLRRTLTGILKASLDFVFGKDAEGVERLTDDYFGVSVVEDR
ncbi:hypothetical protein XA68_11685 [Ophiocordyceps unilateralis]|uniref:1-alkyl-2-acetylglycerophosphocholine esterase n=1 Tax=Ophiocordyceps unilateralis TaxID=268505 RepID=A0A2A9PGI2_OPHUN|nr:hypothetical protein XA68_11685 [Ophiocordyceps unilateralis]